MTWRRRYSRSRSVVGDGEQQLGQVAADLALDADRHHDPLEVAALHPLGDALQGVLER